LAIVVSMPELSEFITSVGDQFAATAYILYGKDRVLAHPNLTSRHPDIGEGNPAVRLNRVGDPVLAGLTSRERVRGFERAAAAGVNVDMVTVADETFVVFNGRINDYGGVPWTVGAYVPEDQVNTELRRLLLSGLAGLAVLAVSILAAFVMGRRLARPIRRMARSAAQVGTLDLDDVAPLMPSRIRELQDQASAFNTMLGGLRWFETYVPRSLVKRLMASGESRQFESAERDVTVLFTDIVGFTPLSESMPAADTAALLNRHFALLGACIESEGGTIDKFIGDALMAFWGAPEAQDDHAARACRAANAIVAAVAADNAQRRDRGLPALRIRIGIHSGPVVVGNIGAPGRINYTIVGDTVNAAQRLEALGKELDDGADVTVLVSATAADAVGRAAFDLTALGAFEVKGKQAPMEVFRLKSIV
ncbi:MAG: adenylate/guanylate cyclase domain-containing protein, partial [Alphaproteobacteria bacterium]|nr:adenylate/guanylate cyclase domain-containing protein [Alphaproteobacteria bacterium]